MILFLFFLHFLKISFLISLTENVAKALSLVLNVSQRYCHFLSYLVLKSRSVIQFSLFTYSDTCLFSVFLSNVLLSFNYPVIHAFKCAKNCEFFSCFFTSVLLFFNPFYSSLQANFSGTQLLSSSYHLAQNHQLISYFSRSNPAYMKNLIISITFLIHFSYLILHSL